MMNVWKIAALALGLAGCTAGPLSEGKPLARLSETVSGIATAATAAPAPAPAAAAAGGGLTRDLIEAAPTNLLRVSLISLSSTDLLTEVGNNAGRTTWMSRDGASFTFQNGLLIASRGIGSDLMGANVSGADGSLARGGSHTRVHDYLTGLDQIEQLTFQCQTIVTDTETITIFERDYVTSVIEETCVSGDLSFKNTYWRDRSGTIWQARQWISAQIGYLGYQRL